MEGIAQGKWSGRRMDVLTRRTFQNYGQYLLDYMVMHRLRPSNKDRWIEEEVGGEHMIEALRSGKGVICITPHLGNWEIGGLLFSFKGGKLNVLTLDERDQQTKSFREEMRGRKGIKNIYIDPKDESPMAILDAVKALRRNEIVAMLGDRIESQKTMVFDFFGRPTPSPSGLPFWPWPPVPLSFLSLWSWRRTGSIGASSKPPSLSTPIHRETREEVIRQGMEKLIKIYEDYIGRYPISGTISLITGRKPRITWARD